VLSNLSCRYIRKNPPTIAGITEILSAGLERKSFDRLKEIAGVSNEQLGTAIGIPMRTLARRVKFGRDESERILRVASAFQKTIEVFDDLDKARRWFTSPKRALNDKTPLEFCSTGLGAQEVERLLGRIEHGVFS
jgi:putative toxin-antitoxin system antitoxin component (TIGR02293 family)